jgi:hypothetical protein
MFPLMSSLSVFFLGMVQVRETWLPVREAARSATGSGSLREGGKGAPGVPQPERQSTVASPISAAVKLQLGIAFIAP